jgi:hypothetical protein
VNDKDDVNYVLDKLGVKSAATKDLLIPGIRGHLHGFDLPGLQRPPHTRDQTVEYMKRCIERSRERNPNFLSGEIPP